MNDTSLLNYGAYDAGSTASSWLGTSAYADYGLSTAGSVGAYGVAGLGAGGAAYIAGLGMQSGLDTDLAGTVLDTTAAYTPGWSGNAVFDYSAANPDYNYNNDYLYGTGYSYSSDYSGSYDYSGYASYYNIADYSYSYDYSSYDYSSVYYNADYSQSYSSYSNYDWGSYYNTYYNYDSFYWDYTYSPVMLDLSGGGIDITPLTSSNTYFDTAGDGRQHRTAWAGAGDAVLAIDADSNGAIDQRNEIVFTDWDPAAANDMQAIANVFDTNHNGLLDAGDARFTDFRLIVTNADGTTSLQTLAQAGIASIGLTPDATQIALPDGSTIDGQTTFTRTGGGTGTAATVTLASDGTGYVLQTAVTHNGDGSTTIANTALNADGSVASETILVTSADGNTRTLSSDGDGDGVVDSVQTIATITNGDGSATETLTNALPVGLVLNRTVTTTSADGNTIAITRDADGDGLSDQTEARVTAADGSQTIAVTDLNPNGTAKRGQASAVSADGLTRTDQSDLDGNGATDLTTTDVTVVNGDASRTQTVTATNANGTIRSRSVTARSADGSTKTIQTDADGNGTFDLTQAFVIAFAADHASTSTETDTNADGSLRAKTVVDLSADGLSRTTQSDVTGDGVYDITTTDVSVINPDGSRTQTVSETNANGSLRSRTITVKGADGLSRTIQTDTNGDGGWDSVETIAANGASETVDTVSQYNVNGSLNSGTVTTSSADGLTVATQTDIDGDGASDGTQTTVTALNADGSSTVTQTDTSANGTLLDKIVTTTSADGLSTATQTDLNGDAAFDITTADVTVVNGDGSRTQTVTARSANNTLLSWSEQIISADRMTTTVTQDANGDGHNDSVETVVTLTGGDVVDTLSSFNPNGSLLNRVITTTSANGLAATTQTDADGDGTFDLTATDVITLGTDGSQTETVTDRNADASLRDQTIVTTSDDGLSTTEATDANGDGIFDLTTASSTVLGADGSQTTTVTDTSANGTVIDRQVTTTSASGLTTATSADLNGDGTFDRIMTDAITLGADGSQTETVTNRNADNSLRDQTVTAVSADGLSTTITQDTDGDGHLDLTETIVTATDGTTTDQVTVLAADGSVITATTQTTSADGLTVTLAKDLNGDGFADTMTTTATALNADGSTTAVASVYAGITLVKQTTVVTSADGLSITTRVDANGDGVADLTTTDVTALHADGSTTQTVTDISADGTHRDQITTEVSADGLTTAIWEGFAADIFRKKKTIATQADGSQLTTVTYPNVTYEDDPHGYVRFQVNQQSVSANGLSSEIVVENEYSAQFQVTDVTTLNADGSRTQVMTDLDGAGYDTTLATSADGLSKSVQMTSAANYTDPALALTATDITALGADGSTTQTITDTITQTTSNFTTGTDELAITTSADGLATSTQLDIDGDGDDDRSDTTVTAVDGSKTETLSVYNPATGALQERTVTTTSADGRSQSLERDSDGDGVSDHFETTVVNADGSQTGTVWNTDAVGTLTGRFVTTTSGDGLSKTTTSDVNGDGTVDYSQTSLTTLLADGRQVTGLSDFYGNGAVRHRTVTTTSADGLTTTVESDLSGDGIIDETQTSVKVLNADGTTTETITTRYADGSLKNKTTTQDDTRRYEFLTASEFDTDGDGLTNRELTAGADRVNSSWDNMDLYNSDGTFRNSISQETSTDGSTLNISHVLIPSFAEENIYYMPNSNGSYLWTQFTPDVSQTSTHTIDLAGVDHWVYSDENASSQNTTYYTVTIDLAAEKKAIEIARRLYDTAFDRTMSEEEIQMLAKYIAGGVLDAAALAGEVLDSDEFADKYGTLSNVQFVERVYDNAVGRAPSLAELSELAGQLNTGTLTRTAALNLVSESQEHLIAGNEHFITNNTMSSYPIALDHTADKQIAGDIVRRLYDTAFDRRATTQEVEAYAQDILDGDRSEAEVAAAILALPEFASTYGTLTDAAFVAQIFVNALGRAPTAPESAFWTSALTAGTVSRADFLDGVARSSEHLAIMGTGSAIGGDGDDVIYAPDNAVNIDGGAGTNTVNYSLLSMPGVTVNLAAGTATKANGNIDTLANIQNVTGGSANDVITGNAGNNVLDGGLGTDTLTGGLGNDIYVADGISDIIVEAAGGGTDTVQSSVTQTALAANVENITLTGSAAINAVGNTLNNVLTGNSAVNTLTGGLGNDTYVVQNTGDVVVEAAGGGTDTVQSAVTQTALAANVEKLTLTGTATIDGTGNELANTLTGNAANNVLTGLAGNDTLNGGAGVDTLVGGAGNDIYVVDTATDIITEQLNEGTDTVQSAVTQTTLAANVEKLTLTGTATIDGTGNELANTLTGNAANNVLNGLAGNDTLNGGAGVDTLVGGAGNDILTGGTGADSFAFTGMFANDTITDFQVARLGYDIMQFDAAAFSSASAALAACQQAGNNVLITSGVNSVTLQNIAVANLTAENFQIV